MSIDGSSAAAYGRLVVSYSFFEHIYAIYGALVAVDEPHPSIFLRPGITMELPLFRSTPDLAAWIWAAGEGAVGCRGIDGLCRKA